MESCLAPDVELKANRSGGGCNAELARAGWKHRGSSQEGQRLRDVSLHRTEWPVRQLLVTTESKCKQEEGLEDGS